MDRKTSKLSLNPETLRRLDQEEAQHVAGAQRPLTAHTFCYDCGTMTC